LWHCSQFTQSTKRTSIHLLTMTIEDVTNSPKDWEDFWYHSEELGLSYQLDQQDWQDHQKYLDRLKIYRYVEDVVEGKNTLQKRESPLSE